jgi:hypothetical protein
MWASFGNVMQIAPRAINERRAFDKRAATSINDESLA